MGKGDQRKNLESKISNLHLGSEISLLGMRENVQENLWNSDLYVHSAITEGFGLTLLEAMAAGLPVVCTDGKGNRELILEAENGFMIWERDPELLADKIEVLINDKKLRETMGRNARTFAEKFRIDEYCVKLLILYKDSMSSTN